MICAACPPFPGPAAAFRVRLPAILPSLRHALAGLAALSLAAIAVADEAPEGWVPGVLEMPADAEVLSDREIGSTVRMFSFSTAEDTGALLGTWEQALKENGYVIEQGTDELLEGAIEFSGEGIGNAKIVASPMPESGRNLVEFDATLR